MSQLKVGNSLGVMCIFCDCDSQSGIYSYTKRTAKIFRTLGWRTSLISYQPRDDREALVLKSLSEDFEDMLLLPRDKGDDNEVTSIKRFLDARDINVFIPNYRKVSYAAAAKVSRYRTILNIGVCHSDHYS